MTDIVDLAALSMAKHGYLVTRHATWLEHHDSGLLIEPVLQESHPTGSLFQSTSIITTRHPQLVPNGVFEYQHAVGATLEHAISEGVDRWTNLDFPVLLDALRDEPEQCQAFEFTFPRTDGSGLRRRALLGPVEHLLWEATPGIYNGEAEHPFCPCCFLRNATEAFKPLLANDALYAIRMFAAHDENGKTQADCRVNGRDWAAGRQALIEYADTWPSQAGLEQRKQYVIMQTRGDGAA